jgi:hypothetical protein
MREERIAIEAPHDFELDRGRSGPLEYVAAWPDQDRAKGLVLVIPGFGGDADDDYARSLRRHIVEAHGFAAVSVRYHCLQSRPFNGAKVEIEPRDYFMMAGVAALAGLNLAEVSDLNDLTRVVGALDQPVEVSAKLVPARGEYQNFGVLQAMDHVAVVGDLMRRQTVFDESRIIALGSSHGGYIAHMITKVAPGLLAGVIDNSSYVQPPLQYLDLTQKLPELVVNLNGVKASCRVISGWTLEGRDKPNFYDRDCDLIRDMAYPPHLRAAVLSGGDVTAYSMVNSIKDGISPAKVKKRQAERLDGAGMAAKIQIVEEADLDGDLFKSLGHGMDISLKRFFDREIETMSPRERAGWRPGAVSYDCADTQYTFVLSDNAPYVRGFKTPLFEGAGQV